MKKLWVLILLTCLGSMADAEVKLNLDKIFAGTKSSTFATAAMTRDLLLYAAQQGYNVFDLLDETGLYLKARALRLTILGDDLRTAAKTIRLGDKRVDTLFPIGKLISLTVGAKNGTDNELEVRLTGEHSGFLELGDFFLDRIYGFRLVGEKKLEGAYGIRVKSGMMNWDLEKIERVPDPNGAGSQNYIAIHLALFPKAKRWLIEPVRPYSPQEMDEHR